MIFGRFEICVRMIFGRFEICARMTFGRFRRQKVYAQRAQGALSDEVHDLRKEVRARDVHGYLAHKIVPPP
jgi:hypothetical protein